LGLLPALEWQFDDFKRRTNLAGSLTANADEIPLGSDQATVCFRVFQEALTNVARHAQATRVDVEIDVGPQGLALTVRDDGRGMDLAALPAVGHLGLAGMRQRAESISGTLDLISREGEGAAVVLKVPLNRVDG
jgi:signal transduction histidine kinase